MLKKNILLSIFQFLLLGIYFIFIFFNFNFIETVKTFPSWLQHISLGLIFIGILIIFLGIVNLGFSKAKIIKQDSNETILFNGIYRYIKHPVYLGIFCCLFGFSIFIQSPISLLVSLLIMVVFYYKSILEDKELEKQYEFYKTYNKNTGRFFPKINKK